MTQLPPDTLETGIVRAAGAVVWRRAGSGEVEILLVHRPKYDDWSLPKGKLDRGEHAVAAAVREVTEETGLSVRLGRPLGDQHYSVTTKSGDQAAKTVSYWAAQAPADGGTFTPNSEVDAIAWLPLDDAADRLTWDRDADVLDAMRAGPLVTCPVLVLRHSEAVSRDGWPGTDDDKRPLSPLGERQAAHLVPLIGAYGVRRIVSSPALRCIDTVAPYAAAAGVAIRTDEALTERGAEADPSRPVDVLAELVRADEPALVCTHRPVLPPLLAALTADSDTQVGDPPLDKGDFVVAHVADGRVVCAERHAP